MQQFELEFEPPDSRYIGQVIRDEDPYVKILSRISWSMHYKCYIALAQVESALCVIEVKYHDGQERTRASA